MQILADPDLRKMLVRSGRDEIMFDLDGDGVADICLSSENEYGDIDTISFDLTGNGEFNLFLHDLDGNGIPDTILWADDNSEDLQLIAFGPEVEEGLINAAARIRDQLTAEEFANEELGISLADMAEYMKENVEAMTEELNRRANAEGIEKVYYFIDEAEMYFLATEEGGQPHVRPFGTILLFDGKLYIQTGKAKDVSKQLASNPKAELCAYNEGSWLRVAGELANDDSTEVKKAMLDKYPELRAIYNEEDDNTQVLYFKNAKATFSSFTAPAEEIEF